MCPTTQRDKIFLPRFLKHIHGPVGVQARILDKSRIHSLGWKAKVSFEDGLAQTYTWIKEQVENVK